MAHIAVVLFGGGCGGGGNDFDLEAPTPYIDERLLWYYYHISRTCKTGKLEDGYGTLRLAPGTRLCWDAGDGSPEFLLDVTMNHAHRRAVWRIPNSGPGNDREDIWKFDVAKTSFMRPS